MGEAVTLRVAEAFQQDIGLGTARLDVGTRQRLKVGVGDIVEIRGRKTTSAVVNRAQQDDEGKNLIRVEAVVRRNAGVSIGSACMWRTGAWYPEEAEAWSRHRKSGK